MENRLSFHVLQSFPILQGFGDHHWVIWMSGGLNSSISHWKMLFFIAEFTLGMILPTKAPAGQELATERKPSGSTMQVRWLQVFPMNLGTPDEYYCWVNTEIQCIIAMYLHTVLENVQVTTLLPCQHFKGQDLTLIPVNIFLLCRTLLQHSLWIWLEWKFQQWGYIWGKSSTLQLTNFTASSQRRK